VLYSAKEEKLTNVIEGRIWKFGDNINSDLIFPNSGFRVPEAEQHRLTFSVNRPGWVDEVKPGDLIVAGKDFGMGSAGRPTGKVLRQCGVAGVVAESLNGLCMRNLVGAAIPAMQCPGIYDLFEEGDTGRFDLASGLVTNVTSSRSIKGNAMPKLLLDIVTSGGALAMLIREGYVEARGFIAAVQ
jgi:3-isopropylmalate/(R)-2-methylmalate dehydratase small subunit